MIHHPAYPVEPWCLRETKLDLAVLAQSEAQARALWHVRESISEAQKREGAEFGQDVEGDE